LIILNHKMISKYYLTIRPQTNENHSVHKEDCPFLPDDEKRIYLGMFNCCQDAIREGQKHFNRTNSCRFCMKEHQSVRWKPAFSEINDMGNMPTDYQIYLYLKGNLFYNLN
jgi:hypothetical protein